MLSPQEGEAAPEGAPCWFSCLASTAHPREGRQHLRYSPDSPPSPRPVGPLQGDAKEEKLSAHRQQAQCSLQRGFAPQPYSSCWKKCHGTRSPSLLQMQSTQRHRCHDSSLATLGNCPHLPPPLFNLLPPPCLSSLCCVLLAPAAATASWTCQELLA